MPFKMIANRSVYRIDDGKEYKKDEPFTVATEKERDRLVRNKRARVDDTKESPKPPVKRAAVEPDAVRRQPVMQQKVMTAEDAPASADAPVAAAAEPELPKPNRYRRSDLRAED